MHAFEHHTGRPRVGIWRLQLTEVGPLLLVVQEHPSGGHALQFDGALWL